MTADRTTNPATHSRPPLESTRAARFTTRRCSSARSASGSTTRSASTSRSTAPAKAGSRSRRAARWTGKGHPLMIKLKGKVEAFYR